LFFSQPAPGVGGVEAVEAVPSTDFSESFLATAFIFDATSIFVLPTSLGTLMEQLGVGSRQTEVVGI
jgi:hypothetical protein